MAQSRSKGAKAAPRISKKATPAKAEEKRVYFKQADFPQSTLQQAQRIASALIENFAGDSGSPPGRAGPALSLFRATTGMGIGVVSGAG